jgi:hypothetical protein
VSVATSIGGGGGGGAAGAVTTTGATSTDNAIARFDGTDGTKVQDSAITIADESAGSVTVATKAGDALVVQVTAPAAAASSQAGVGETFTASAAVAGSSVNGSAAGGGFTWTTGAAARLVSGNSNGGDYTLNFGAGIGTGTTGALKLTAIGGRTNPIFVIDNGSEQAGFYVRASDILGITLNNTTRSMEFNSASASVGNDVVLGWDSNAKSTSSAAVDTALSRGGSGGIVAVGTGAAGSTAGEIQATTHTVVTANGGQWILGSASELLTLSTSGATTDTSANLLPANAIIESVVARITTTITTATNWKLGDATIAGRFTAANGTLTAGTTDIGLVHIDQTGTSGPRQTAAAKVRVTTTGTPGAGAVRITVFYRQFVAPTS